MNLSWGRYGSIQSLVANKNLTRAKHYRLTESTVNNNAWIRDQHVVGDSNADDNIDLMLDLAH